MLLCNLFTQGVTSRNKYKCIPCKKPYCLCILGARSRLKEPKFNVKCFIHAFHFFP